MAKDQKNGSLSGFLYAVGKAIQFSPSSTFAPPRSEEKSDAKKGGFPFLFYRLKMKTALAKMSEQSFVLGLLKRFYGRFFNTRVRSFGILFFTLGFLQILSYFLGESLPLLAGGEDHLLFGVCLIFLTLLCSFSRGDVKDAIKRSFLYRIILKPLFGIQEEHFPLEKSRDHVWPMILAGALLSFFSVLFSPLFVLAFLLCMILLLMIFHIPEAGLLVAALGLFVLSPSLLFALSILTLVAFLFKCAIGKRSMAFSPTDAIVFSALLPIMFSPQKGGSLLSLPLFCFYFLASCLLRNVKWLQRFFAALAWGGILYAMMICLRFIVFAAMPNFFLQFSAAERLFLAVADENAVALLVILCPLIFGRIRSAQRSGKMLFSLAFFAICIVSLFFAARGILWIAFAVAVILFLLMSRRAFLLLFSAFGILFATVINLLPSDWLSRIVSAFHLSSAENAPATPQSFLSLMRAQFGFWAPILFFILIAFVLYRSFYFSSRATLPSVFPLVLGTICASLSFLVLSLFFAAPNEKAWIVLMFLAAIPEAALRCAKREEIRLPY